MRNPVLLFYTIVCLNFLPWGCNSLAVKDDLTDASFRVVNQDSVALSFPSDFTGKITVLSYIYTNCPDVCPLITSNMKQIRNKLPSTEQVQFIGVSFDPQRDTPAVLNSYARNYELTLPEWQLLTGNVSDINSLMNRLNIQAEQSYTSFTKNGTPVYYINHTDRITLIDSNGRIRNNYTGSRAKTEEVVSDINRLLTQTKP